MKWLADENFRGSILRGLRARSAEFDIVRAQDIEFLYGSPDTTLLDWATRNERVLLTHDVSTMIPAMTKQLRLSSRCTPIVLVPDFIPIGIAIEQVLLLELCATDVDWSAGLIYLPLK